MANKARKGHSSVSVSVGQEGEVPTSKVEANRMGLNVDSRLQGMCHDEATAFTGVYWLIGRGAGAFSRLTRFAAGRNTRKRVGGAVPESANCVLAVSR